MLHELHIRNFAIIDDLYLAFGPGLNVLTGETGAGKSIIIDALGLLLGDRASADWVRAGSELAEIEATFRLSAVAAPSASGSTPGPSDHLDIDSREMDPDGEERTDSATGSAVQLRRILAQEGLDDPDNPGWVSLAREVRRSGRNICRVNGRAVSLQILSAVSSLLIDVHGQGEHLNLLRPRTHIHLLDRYAGLVPMRNELATQVRALRQIRAELERLRQDERTLAQRIDMLGFQAEEIFNAQLQPGEDDELDAERRRLSNAETLINLAGTAQAILAEDGGDGAPSALDMLGEVVDRLERLARIDPDMEPSAAESQGVLEQLSDLARALQDYADQLEFNPDRLEEVEERLEIISNLKRKYGDTIEQINAFGAQAQAELADLGDWETKTAQLVQEEDKLLYQIGQRAAELSARRQNAGEQMARQVETELADLKMVRARMGVTVEQVAHDHGAYLPDGRRVAFDTTGVDRVEFLISANPGEPLKPLARVASGGETARIMLALKSVLAHADATPTLIFDEIDQGIGGRVGAIVGQKLWNLTGAQADAAYPDAHTDQTHSSSTEGTMSMHQVLCITHLPQLAAFGDQHFTVNKRIQLVDGTERTSTVVDRLESEARVQELMQMLGATTEAGRLSVEEMLAEVAAVKGQKTATTTAARVSSSQKSTGQSTDKSTGKSRGKSTRRRKKASPRATSG